MTKEKQHKIHFKNYKWISLVNIDVYVQLNTSKLNPPTYKKNYASLSNGIFPGVQTWFQIQKSTNVILVINRTKDKNNDYLNRDRKKCKKKKFAKSFHDETLTN